MPEDTGTAKKAWRWLFTAGSRRKVNALLLAAVFLTTLFLGMYGPVPIHEFLLDGVSTSTALLYFLTGSITILTIVLSVNQLVLSYQIGPIEKQRSAVEDTLTHRDDLHDILPKETVPTRPVPVLRDILGAIAIHASRFQDSLGEKEEDIAEQIAAIIDDAEQVKQEMDGRSFMDTRFLHAAMRFRGAHRLDDIRNLKREHDIDREELEVLKDAILIFVITEEYFKTARIQAELIRFSRTIILIGFPAIILTLYATQIIGPGTFPGATLGIDNLLIASAAAFTVAVAPLTTLVTYASRITNLTKTTIISGPFLPETSKDV